MPFATTVSKRDNSVGGANSTGCERPGFRPIALEHLQNALRPLTRAKLNTSPAVELIEAEIPALLAFIQPSERGGVK